MKKLTYTMYSSLPYLLLDVVFFAALYFMSVNIAYAYPGENCVKEDMSCQDACLRIPLTSPDFKTCAENCTKTANACIEREKAAASNKEHSEPPQ